MYIIQEVAMKLSISVSEHFLNFFNFFHEKWFEMNGTFNLFGHSNGNFL